MLNLSTVHLKKKDYKNSIDFSNQVSSKYFAVYIKLIIVKLVK